MKIQKYLNRIKFVISLVGTSNWYEGVDKPNIYQYLFKWRIGFETAYKVAKIIYK